MEWNKQPFPLLNSGAGMSHVDAGLSPSPVFTSSALEQNTSQSVYFPVFIGDKNT